MAASILVLSPPASGQGFDRDSVGAARGALLVGASGAALGAVIGSLSERWDRIHP